MALQLYFREEADSIIDKVIEAGGKKQRDPEDHEFMYARAFEDPNHHIWELFWMNPDR